MKSTVRNKLQVFAKAELPLLLKSGLFPELADSQFFGGCKFSGYDSGLGKAKVLGPNPGQGSPIIVKGAVDEDFDDLRTLPNGVRSSFPP